MPEQVIESALEKAGVKKEEVDWLVMHQANQRILDACAERLALPKGAYLCNERAGRQEGTIEQ